MVILCISVLFVILIELQGRVPLFIVAMFPLIGFLVLYNVSILINGNNLRRFCSTVRGILSIVCLLFFVVGICIPVNEFTTYLSKSPHPLDSTSGFPHLHRYPVCSLFP